MCSIIIMSKKTFTLILVLLLAVITGVVWYFFFHTSSGVVTSGNETGSTNNLFPFGKGTGNTAGTENKTNNSGEATAVGDNGTASIPKLRHISMVPTAGVVAFNHGSTTVIRYVERATGHTYETISDSSEISGPKEISNTTIPKIYEAFWSKDGNSLLMRYLRDDNQTIRTFYARISTTTDVDSALEGTFLDDNIRDISVSGNKIFYLIKNSLGEQGILANIDGSKKVAIFNSTFGDWGQIWGASSKFVTIFTKPDSTVSGNAYTLNTSTGEYSKIFVGNGLSAISNVDGSYVLGSGASGSGVATSVFDATKNLVSLVGIKTLVDKCVWSIKEKTIVYCAVPNTVPVGQYPNDWYLGNVSFSDSVWKIDVSNGNTEQLFDPLIEGQQSMDMENLSLSDKENTLVFINKKDMTAWSYNVSE